MVITSIIFLLPEQGRQKVYESGMARIVLILSLFFIGIIIMRRIHIHTYKIIDVAPASAYASLSLIIVWGQTHTTAQYNN